MFKILLSEDSPCPKMKKVKIHQSRNLYTSSFDAVSASNLRRSLRRGSSRCPLTAALALNSLTCVFSYHLRLCVLKSSITCKPKKKIQNLAKFTWYSENSRFVNFQNLKSFNFRVLKLEICQFSSLIVQFSSFETRDLSIFEFQENETKWWESDVLKLFTPTVWL